MYNNMQSNPDNYWQNHWTDEELFFLFLKESESQQSSHHLPSHHQPHQPIHQPPHQQPPSQQMQQDPFNYRTQQFIESHSLLQRILIHGKRSVTGGYYENRNESSSTSRSNNQVVSRDWETASTSSSNQVSPTIAEGNQSVATLQQPYQQQQIFYEQNYIDHSANYDTSMPSQPRMQAPYVQPILYSCLQQQQGTNGNNNNNFKQENRHRNINNRDRHGQLSPYDSSTSFAWINKTNANQATGTERKRTRQTYTQKQTFELEKEFHTSKYLPKLRREQLSTNIHLSERQIKIWFQNRRMKAKKTKNVLQNDSPSSTTTTTDVVTSINNSRTSMIPIQEEQILNLPRLQPIMQQFDGAYQNYLQPYQHSTLSARSPEMQYHNAISLRISDENIKKMQYSTEIQY